MKFLFYLIHPIIFIIFVTFFVFWLFLFSRFLGFFGHGFLCFLFWFLIDKKNRINENEFDSCFFVLEHTSSSLLISSSGSDSTSFFCFFLEVAFSESDFLFLVTCFKYRNFRSMIVSYYNSYFNLNSYSYFLIFTEIIIWGNNFFWFRHLILNTVI